MRKYRITFTLSIIIMFLVGCVGKSSILKQKHEETFAGRPNCLDCHEKDETVGNKPFSAYIHNDSFFDRHGKIVDDFSAVCELCHAVKFCSDCHAVKEEIVPSRKLGNRPDLSSPHRGDYLNTHKIDGHLEKDTCFKCHGRRNNDTCKRCHNP